MIEVYKQLIELAASLQDYEDAKYAALIEEVKPHIIEVEKQMRQTLIANGYTTDELELLRDSIY